MIMGKSQIANYSCQQGEEEKLDMFSFLLEMDLTALRLLLTNVILAKTVNYGNELDDKKLREYRYDLCGSNYHHCCAQHPEDRTSDSTRAKLFMITVLVMDCLCSS